MHNGRRDAAGKFLDWRSEVFPKRKRWPYFSHKREGLVKCGACFKNVGGIIYVHLTLSSVIFLWVLGVHLCCLFIYTISVSILCVRWEELRLIESNQQIYAFCKRLFFEKQRRCGTLKVNFSYQQIIHSMYV